MTKSTHYLWPLTTIFCFSAGLLLTKKAMYLNPAASTIEVAAWGWTLGILAATLIFYLPQKKQRTALVTELKNHGKFTLIISLLGIISGFLWFLAVDQMSGGVAALADQNIVLWSFLLGVLFLREKLSLREILAIIVTLVGLAIISQLQGEATALGIAASFGGGLFLAIQSVIMKKYKGFNFWALTFWRAWSLSAFAIITTLTLNGWSFPGLVFVLTVGFGQFLGLFLGRAAYIKAHEYFPIGQLSFMLTLIPVIGLLGATLFLDEPLPNQKILGALVIIGGLLWFTYEKQALLKSSKV